MLLRRLRFLGIDPGFGVNLSEKLSGKSVPACPEGSQVSDFELVASIGQPDGGSAGKPAGAALFFDFMGIGALWGWPGDARSAVLDGQFV
jgi:hypothetical protein